MTTYFVSTQTGSNGNAGTSAALPWATLTKALVTSPLASGDTLYVAPGTYRESLSLGTPTSPGSTISILGDIGLSQAWGASVAAGPVLWTGYTTDDLTAPNAQAPLVMNGKGNLLFQALVFIGSAEVRTIRADTAGSVGVTFRDCTFQPVVGSAAAIGFTGTANVASNWLIDRCIILTGGNAGSGVNVLVPRSNTTDYDIAFVVQNCLIIGNGTGVLVNETTGTGTTAKGGGVKVYNCTLLCTTGMSSPNANISTTSPNVMKNCLLGGCSTGLSAQASGMITEDWNHFFACGTMRTNVSIGANSNGNGTVQTVPCPALSLGHEWLQGVQPRPFLVPLPTSPLLGRGNDLTVAPTADLRNRPRPAGRAGATGANVNTTGTATAGATGTLTDGGASWTVNGFKGYSVKLTGGTGSGQQRLVASNTATVLTVATQWSTTPDNTSVYAIYQPAVDFAVGALERHDTGIKETSVTQAGATALKLTGPSDQDLQVPVDTGSQTLSIYGRYDTAHGTGTKPQVLLLANGEIGVGAQTLTMTAAVDTWEKLTTASFSPTAKGVVTLRLVNRAAAGNGLAYFDSVGV